MHQNGTLLISNPTIDDAGIYRCEATNYLGRDTATADVRFNGKLPKQSERYSPAIHLSLSICAVQQ